MRWLDEPPAVGLNVEHEAPGVLHLTGPTTSDRVKGGAVAAFGAGFTAFAVPFLRLPIPGPFKLVPLVSAPSARASSPRAWRTPR
jgi:hypothetical protein